MSKPIGWYTEYVTFITNYIQKGKGENKMFTVNMKTGNSAFMNPYGENDHMAECQEVARILREIAYQIENGIRTKGSCMDYNGNKVGEFELS